MHDIVIGMLLGDEGKGATVSALSAHTPTDYVIRASGGAQNAHNVIEQGHRHKFSQFGSGTLHGVPTITSRFCMVDPLRLAEEGYALSTYLHYNVFADYVMSGEAKILTALHAVGNRLREDARGNAAHGSCGLGIGELMWFTTSQEKDPLRFKDLRSDNLASVEEKINDYVEWLQQFFPHERIMERLEDITGKTTVKSVAGELVQVTEQMMLYAYTDEEISRLIQRSEHLVFEGSQGVLLDEWLGFHPHTTWSTTTHQNAYTLLEEAGLNPRTTARKVGCIRTYTTRHGHGPFPTMITDPEMVAQYPELHNGYGQYQGGWKVGDFDLPLFRYALAVTEGVDALSISHCDVEAARTLVDYDITLPVIRDEDVERQEEEATSMVRAITAEDFTSHTYENLEDMLSVLRDEANGAPIILRSYGMNLEDRVFAEGE